MGWCDYSSTAIFCWVRSLSLPPLSSPPAQHEQSRLEIMSLSDKFISQNDSELVMRDFYPSVSTSPAPVRTVTLPPLGFPPLPSVTDLSTNIAVTPDQVLTAALASLPLWFLLGSGKLPESSADGKYCLLQADSGLSSPASRSPPSVMSCQISPSSSCLSPTVSPSPGPGWTRPSRSWTSHWLPSSWG